jgi:hypothetical protein
MQIKKKTGNVFSPAILLTLDVLLILRWSRLLLESLIRRHKNHWLLLTVRL